MAFINNNYADTIPIVEQMLNVLLEYLNLVHYQLMLATFAIRRVVTKKQPIIRLLFKH